MRRHEPKLVIPDQRVLLNKRVTGRAGVDGIARTQDLFRRRAAARDIPRVNDGAALPRSSKVAGGDQAVVPGPGDDEIRRVVLRHQSPIRRILPR